MNAIVFIKNTIVCIRYRIKLLLIKYVQLFGKLITQKLPMLSLRKNSETADTLDSANVSMFPNQKAASLSRVHQMLDSLPVNIMTCELEGLTIDYVYKTSIETLRTLEHHIPSGADDIVGQ